VVINGNLTTAPLLNPKLPFDPAKDFTFVSLLGTAPLVMVTNADKPAGADFFAAARAGGTSWSFGSVGIGSVGHLGMEALLSQAGIGGVTHVPYNGNPAVITALISGQVQIGLMPPGIALPQAQAGKVRVVGVTGPASPLAPGVQPLNSMGVKLQDLEVWTAVVAAAGVPAAARERMERDIPALLRTAEVRDRLLAVGWQAQGSGPEAMRTRVQAEAELLGGIIRRQGIKTQ
jgi:tripartite-type tricarboxylate transporter receptor subunit TctC